MTQNGERLSFYNFNDDFAYNRDDQNSWWPNWLAGTLSGIFLNGDSTLLCGQQWEKVQAELNKLKLDAKWIFNDTFTDVHEFGTGISDDQNDPILFIDPWKNSFSAQYPIGRK